MSLGTESFLFFLFFYLIFFIIAILFYFLLRQNIPTMKCVKCAYLEYTSKILHIYVNHVTSTEKIFSCHFPVSLTPLQGNDNSHTNAVTWSCLFNSVQIESYNVLCIWLLLLNIMSGDSFMLLKVQFVFIAIYSIV